MKLNKTRVAVIVGLMVAGYFAMSIMVPFEVPYFANTASCIVALFFPYITKKYRMLVTGIYQTYRVFMVGLLLSSMKELLFGVLLHAPTPVPEISGKPLINILILESIHIPIYGTIALLVYGAAYGYVAFVICSTILMYTQPYSIYLIYKWLGLVKRMEKAFPNASPEWFRS